MAEPVHVLTQAFINHGAVPLGEAGEGGYFSISHYRVVLAGLPPAVNGVGAAAEAALERALEVWRSVPGMGVADIYLLFAGPWRSDHDAEWEALAGGIERDQRVCRKLVWLPDEDGGNLERFLGRTFLARPWDEVESAGASALEALESDFSLPDGWLSLLLDSTLTETDLIERLVEALPEEKA